MRKDRFQDELLQSGGAQKSTPAVLKGLLKNIESASPLNESTIGRGIRFGTQGSGNVSQTKNGLLPTGTYISQKAINGGTVSGGGSVSSILGSLFGGLGGGSGSGGLGSLLGGFLGGGFGLSSLVSGLTGLFGGGSSAPPPLVPFQLPPPVSFQGGIDGGGGGGLGPASYSQNGAPRGGSGQQMTIQVQAMDSKSFLDHSEDIAQAVRQAMLHSNSLNDVVADL